MGEVRRVTIPYSPRKQFRPFHDTEKRFSCIVAHRRAGKTVACVNHLIRAAIMCDKPDPRFAYIAPFFSQAKDVAWNYIKKYGMVIPGAEANESELRIDFPNGGRVRLYGADNYDRLRGIYLDGVVLDENADMDPRAWSEVIRPALSDRQGFAVFIGTPKGRNAFFEKWQEAQTNDDWFALMMRASETKLIAQKELDLARSQMTPEQYDQEFECSFNAAIMGAYYGPAMEQAEKDKRIGRVPWEPNVEVHTAWDLGIGDSTAIWFCQRVGREWRLIDFLENRSVGLEFYVKELKSRPYVYGEHILPHDASVKELQTGISRLDFLSKLGIRGRVLPQHRVEDGINGVRAILPQCWFDMDKCGPGIEALRQYRADWDDKRKVLRDNPLHDWTSHAADAFRYLAMGTPKGRADDWGKPMKFDAKWVL